MPENVSFTFANICKDITMQDAHKNVVGGGVSLVAKLAVSRIENASILTIAIAMKRDALRY